MLATANLLIFQVFSSLKQKGAKLKYNQAWQLKLLMGQNIANDQVTWHLSLLSGKFDFVYLARVLIFWVLKPLFKPKRSKIGKNQSKTS